MNTPPCLVPITSRPNLSSCYGPLEKLWLDEMQKKNHATDNWYLSVTVIVLTQIDIIAQSKKRFALDTSTVPTVPWSTDFLSGQENQFSVTLYVVLNFFIWNLRDAQYHRICCSPCCVWGNFLLDSTVLNLALRTFVAVLTLIHWFR